jgi:CPA1 family monovalent cation:H+ antiporter
VTQIALTVFALAALLGIVSLMLPLAERLRIPHAVLLAAIGCAIGALVAGSHGEVGVTMADDVLKTLGTLDLTADAFLFIFLPALLFETSINVDVRRLSEDIAPVLVLAIIGVLVSTFVVGVVLWPISGVGLLACLLLGAILATTDPVAVVAVFRDIGAPRRLSLLVEGESLLNDAAAIALFSLLAAMLTGAAETSALGAAGMFVVDFVGGIGFGCLMGWLACRVLPTLSEHQLAESTLTVALAYFTFVVGDHYLHISGVVAVVAAGLVVSGEGRRRLPPSNWEALERTWQQIGFWASSLIFLLAAMMVPETLAGASWLHLGLLAALILAATGARAITLFGLLPILSALGLAQSVRTNQKLVMLWGGMRGAVSLALALAATENPLLPAEVRELVGVLATGFVLFTLFISAPTLRPLMHRLGLDRLSPAEVALRDRVVALSLSTIQEDLGRIAGEHEIDPAVSDEAKRPYQRHVHAAAEIAEENAQIDPAPRLHSALVILVEREQEFYLEYFDARTMSPRAVAALLTHAAWLRDAVKTGTVPEYHAAVERTLAFPPHFRAALWAQRWGIERPLAIELADRFEVLLAQRLVLGELDRFTQRELKILFGAGIAETLGAELARRRGTVDQAIAALMLQYPSYARSLQQRFLVLTAIRLEQERYQRLLSESILTTEVFNDLTRGLTQRRQAAERRPRLDLGLSRIALIERVPLFAELEPQRRRKLCRLLKPRLVVPGETIVRHGERGDSMYFVSSGAVEVRLPAGGAPIRLGSGDFFGELALILEQPRNADVVALGYCRLLSLARRDLERLFRTDATLKTRIHAVARERLRPRAAA